MWDFEDYKFIIYPIDHFMVRVAETSGVNIQKYPIWNDWDSKVRKSYNLYQNLIDAKTYQLQRIQRYLFSLPYPHRYDSDLITLNLLKKKQRVGEVTSHQADLYQSIDPDVRANFNTTFSGFFSYSKLGVAVGAGLFAYSTLFNFSMATRIVYLVAPIFTGYFWSIRTPKEQVRTSEFLDWVFQYRKAKVFNEKYQHLFNSQETKAVLGNGNLASLGDQLIKLA